MTEPSAHRNEPSLGAEALERQAVRESVEPPKGRYGLRQRIGLVVGPVVFLSMVVAAAPAGLSVPAWRTAAVATLMAAWWLSEAVPIPVTALLPLVLFPLLGVNGIGPAAAPYFNPLIVLFLGGFIIALGIERWGLHRRMALNIIRLMGTKPRAIIAGFMTAAAVLSMWVSNTATAMMMLPIGLSVVALSQGDAAEGDPHRGQSNFAVALMLGIAYGCSIGGMATLIGTPTNAFLAGYLQETFGYRISFASWLAIGFPLMLIGLPLTHAVLTRVAFPIRLQDLPGGRAMIRDELAKLGPIGRGERMAAIVFASVALLWVFQPLAARVVPGLGDPVIAMLCAISMFLLPVDFKRGVFVLDWETAEKLPWGVLLLFGGGLSVADAVTRTGLAQWIGDAMSGMAGWPPLLIVLLVTIVVVMLTELNSNTATVATFLPVVVALAVGIGQNPLLLAVPTALAASAAFMLPVATPPNAIVYGSSFLTIPQMARAGLVLNVVFALLVAGLTYLLVGPVFGVELGVVPAWAAGVAR